MHFEPRIVGLLCQWCSYCAADAAGSARRSYVPNVHPVRVMCSGRVDPTFVLRAFAEGVDGVLICGCHPGDCHYLTGNCKAAFRIALLRRMVAEFGIDPRRLRLAWISATEGELFAKTIHEMTETIRALGPITKALDERGIEG